MDESWHCSGGPQETERGGAELSRGTKTPQEVPRLLLQPRKPGECVTNSMLSCEQLGKLLLVNRKLRDRYVINDLAIDKVTNPSSCH